MLKREVEMPFEKPMHPLFYACAITFATLCFVGIAGTIVMRIVLMLREPEVTVTVVDVPAITYWESSNLTIGNSTMEDMPMANGVPYYNSEPGVAIDESAFTEATRISSDGSVQFTNKGDCK
jgi:hypothetical protein